MSYGSCLQRHLDTDLIERLEASGKPEQRQTIERKKSPRPFGSYRGSRRNEARSGRYGGARKKMITYAELLRINQIAAARAKQQNGS